MLKEFCTNLPKIELHAHLNGSLSEKTLNHLGCKDSGIGEYQKLNTIINKTEKTLDDCFKLFKVAHNVTNNTESVYYATKAVIEDFHNDNVIYLELRTTPRQEENMTKEDYVETVVKAIQDNTKSIIVKLILCLDRRHDQATSEQALDLIIKMKNKYPNIIKGIDLCGNPSEGCFNGNLFQKAKQNGLKVTIHCAEVSKHDEVREILLFEPDRLGHATYLHPSYGGNQENWDLYRELKIPIECCITSNVICGTSKSFQTHHVQEWINHKLPFCINTDDKGVFCTNLSQELNILITNYNVTKQNSWTLFYDSINYAFCDQTEKELLRQHLKRWKKENMHLYF